MSKETTGAPKAKPVAPYQGGKRNLAKRLCAIIDAHDHDLYAEPFVGMGGVFLRRSSLPRAEFINDRARDVYNLFRILQEHYVPFVEYLRFQISTQAGFDRLMAVDPETLTDLQRAGRFLYLQRSAFGGRVNGRTYAIDRARGSRFNLNTLEGDLEALHLRLSGVAVTCLDFEAFIDRVDTPRSLIYLDPPYVGCETDYGPDLFAPDDFLRLARCLRILKGDFILSINDTPEVREIFEWAHRAPVTVTYRTSGAPTRHGELVISNMPVEIRDG
ncbi:MAG: DNA adenine methylase [Pseudomonadota bacterium]